MRLAFAVASHVDPEILLLDEVLAVGDEAFQRKCLGRIFDYLHAAEHSLFVSHDPPPSSVSAVVRCSYTTAVSSPTAARRMYSRPTIVCSRRQTPKARSDRRGIGRSVVDDDDPRVWGTREVTIRSVRLLGPTVRPIASSAASRSRSSSTSKRGIPVETPTFGITISTADNVVCFGTNTALDAFELREISGWRPCGSLFQALTLLEGHFLLTVAAHSHDERTVYHWLDGG